MAVAKESVPKSLTKAQIIAKIAEKNELTKKQVAAFLESFVELAGPCARNGRNSTISLR